LALPSVFPVSDYPLSTFLNFYSFSALASFMSKNPWRDFGVKSLPPVSSSRMKQWRIAVQAKLKTERNIDPTMYETKRMIAAGNSGC